MPFIPHTANDIKHMLETIGVNNIEELFSDIGADLRPNSFNLPQGQGEMDVCSFMEKVAAKNTVNLPSFLGAGFYDHYIPKAIDALVSRSEFYTAYTPYQPESSQGTLQAIFEYQTAVTRLFHMDCANASIYDGGTAIFEAMLMAVRHTKRKTLVLDESVNPIWRKMVDTYMDNLDIQIVTIAHKNGCPDLEALKSAVDNNSAAVVVQNPNFFGAIFDYTDLFAHAKAQKALSIISVYPMLQTVIKTPGQMGADIAVAEGQSLGLPLSFGGPYLGIMTCTKECIRQLPGRIVGRTNDVDGKVGYVLTLQAREQHIRRAKATSNICSNQALCALRSLIYMSLLGARGMAQIAEISMLNARYAAEKLIALDGVELLHNNTFGNEIAILLPCNAEIMIEEIIRRGLIAGFPVSRYYKNMDNVLLLACTEKNNHEQIDALVKMVGESL